MSYRPLKSYRSLTRIKGVSNTAAVAIRTSRSSMAQEKHEWTRIGSMARSALNASVDKNMIHSPLQTPLAGPNQINT